jgi:hypothetical protein
MPNNAAMIELRNAIDRINKEVMRERGNGEASNREVLDRVRKQHDAEITALTQQLVHIALTKLYNDVSSRKGPKPLNNFGEDLFGNYHGIPQTITIKRGTKKATGKLTFEEVDLWLSPQKPKPEVKKNEALSQLVEDCRPYREQLTDTLEIAMERRRAARETGAHPKA